MTPWRPPGFSFSFLDTILHVVLSFWGFWFQLVLLGKPLREPWNKLLNCSLLIKAPNYALHT